MRLRAFVNAILPLLHVLPFGLAPIPEVGFVLQLAGLGSAIGSLVGLRRAPERAGRVTAAWAALGLVVGLAVLVVSVAVRLAG